VPSWRSILGCFAGDSGLLALLVALGWCCSSGTQWVCLVVQNFKGHATVQPLSSEELVHNDRLRDMQCEADADLEDALTHQYDESYGEIDRAGDDEPAESFLDLDAN
jgi:hypothetical protein